MLLQWRNQISWLFVLSMFLVSCALPAPAPKRVWEQSLGFTGIGRIDTNPLATTDLVYVAGHERNPDARWGEQHVLQARATETGLLAWSTPVGGYAAAPLAADADSVYLMSIGAGLYALDRTNGEQRWFHPLDVRESQTPHLSGDQVVVVLSDEAGARTVRAFDRRTGLQRWQMPVQRLQPFPKLLIADLTTVFLVDGQTLAKRVDGVDTVTAHYIAGELITAGPVGDESVVCVGLSAQVVCVDRWTGRVAWTMQIRSDTVEQLLLTRRALVVASRVDVHAHSIGRGYLVVIDRATHQRVWERETPNPINRLDAEGSLVVASTSHAVIGYELLEGGIAWELQSAATIYDASLVGSALYVANWEGQLRAYQAPVGQDTR